MSIKVYDGMRGTISDPFELAKLIREVLEPLYFEAYGKLVDHARAEYKRSEGKATIKSIFELSSDEWDKNIRHVVYVPNQVHAAIRAAQENSHWTFSDLAVGYEVSILPNGVGGNPLVLVFGELARPYRDKILQAGVVESYGYWDSSDPEEELTVKEWKERKQAWSVIFDSPPAEVGLGFSFPSAMESELSLAQSRSTN